MSFDARNLIDDSNHGLFHFRLLFYWNFEPFMTSLLLRAFSEEFLAFLRLPNAPSLLWSS
jgi:hypothetical protein